MPLNPTTTGDQIAAFVQSVAPTPGTAVTTDQLKILWEGIVKIIYDDLKQNALVAPGTFQAPSSGGPVTGVGGPIS